MKMRAVRIHGTGGPEVLRLEEVPRPEPGEGQALVRLAAAGVNYIDVYHRSGQHHLDLPFTMGQEGAGVVEAVGRSVTEVRPGDRVVYSNVPGSYAEYVVAPAWRLAPVPPDLGFEPATAVMLQGMTAHYLTHTTYPLRAGDTALVHAAAGGVGHLLVQMAKYRGARVIATVSSDGKGPVAREVGADEVIVYTRQDFEAEVKRLTGGQGVQVVYDGVGKDTFEKSLNCLAPRGMMVLYGAASGPVTAVSPQVLNTKGSLFFTRPSLGHYTRTRDEVLTRAGDVLTWVHSGRLRVRIDRTYPLAEVAEAHRRLQSRQATGKILLTVSPV